MSEYPGYVFDAAAETYDALLALSSGQKINLLDFTNQSDMPIENIWVAGEASQDQLVGPQIHLYGFIKLARTALQPPTEIVDSLYDHISRRDKDGTITVLGAPQ